MRVHISRSLFSYSQYRFVIRARCSTTNGSHGEPLPRIQHALTLLDDRVLLFGGEGPDLAPCEADLWQCHLSRGRHPSDVVWEPLETFGEGPRTGPNPVSRGVLSAEARW